MRSTTRRVMGLASVLVVLVASVAAAVLPPGGTFVDDDGNPHEPNIEAIAAQGVTRGCGPSVYCPGASVTREQMATFLVRALGVPATSSDFFSDDAASAHQSDINAVAAAGITTGCGQGLFCPTSYVLRSEMAAFLLRALGDSSFPEPLGVFADVPGDAWYRPWVERLYQRGITAGCAPGLYCPHGAVRRDEMATFLTRALGFTPIVPPPPTTTTTPPPPVSFGNGLFRVGVNIPAGTYRNSTSSSCYWARLSGFGGTLDEIIANSFDDVPNIVTIAASDAGFESSGCGTWRNNFAPRTASPTSSHGGGHFVVGTEVAAGTWQSTGTGTCYWERLRGFGGILDEIIANDFADGPRTVTISASDLGFYASKECGTWNFAG